MYCCLQSVGIAIDKRYDMVFDVYCVVQTVGIGINE